MKKYTTPVADVLTMTTEEICWLLSSPNTDDGMVIVDFGQL